MNSSNTGDVDYALSLLMTLNDIAKNELNATHIGDSSLTGKQIVAQVLKAHRDNPPAIFHHMMNGNRTLKITTGGTMTPEDLEELRAAGVEIVITCIEYGKKSIAESNEVVTNWDRYFKHASQIVFVDEYDKEKGLEKSDIVRNHEHNGKVSVVGIPVTLRELAFDKLPFVSQREANFLCFGMIRRTKGIEKFALPLAKQFKEQGSYKKVIIAGSVMRDNTDPTLLADMFIQAYGSNSVIKQQIEEILKMPSDIQVKNNALMTLYDTTLKEKNPDINVEFYFDVPASNLTSIFRRCRYALNFNNKGVSPHFTGVTNSLMAMMKNYGLDLPMTPDYFKKTGKYTTLAMSFTVQGGYPEEGIVPEEIIAKIAKSILSDTYAMEKSEEMHGEFILNFKEFKREYPIDIESISCLFTNIYKKMINHSELLVTLPLVMQVGNCGFFPGANQALTEQASKLSDSASKTADSDIVTHHESLSADKKMSLMSSND
jgi:hypothetical protein